MKEPKKQKQPKKPKQPKEKRSKHNRVIQSWLSPLEKPALLWLAERMPAWINSDVLTGIGLFGGVLVFAGYALTSIDLRFMWLASFGLVVNWFGDSLDGTIARYRKTERPRYGYFIDHIVDALVEAMVFIGLGLSPYVDLKLALFALVGYFMVSIYVFLTTYISGEFRITYANLGPTEIRVIGIIANTIMMILGAKKFVLPFGSFTFYDLVMIGLILIFYIGFIVISLNKARQLSKEDTLARSIKD